MLDALQAQKRVGRRAHLTRTAFQRNHLHAVVLVDVDVQHRDDEVVAAVLYLGHPVSQFARVFSTARRKITKAGSGKVREQGVEHLPRGGGRREHWAPHAREEQTDEAEDGKPAHVGLTSDDDITAVPLPPLNVR